MYNDVHDTEHQSSAEPEPKSSADGDSASALPSAAETAVGPASDPSHSVWSRVDRNLRWAPLSGKQGPYWHQVIRRVVTDLDTNEIILDQPIDPKVDKREYMTHLPRTTHRVQTDLWFRPQEKPCPTECLTVRQQRQLDSQVRELQQTSFHAGKRLLVAEVFSPPRFATAAQELGFSALSFDLKNGYDFSQKGVRDQVAKMLHDNPPELLVVCPPCTYEGGWHNLNERYMDPQVALQKRLQSRMFIRFACQLFEQQVSLGKRAIFEHPSGARTWTYEEMVRLLKRHHWCKCHMCMYGLRLPRHDKLIRKSTGLLVSHEDMLSLGRCCPGKKHPDHHCHDVIAGSAPGVGQISTFAAQYTPSFVDAVLRTVPKFAQAVERQLVQLVDHTEQHENEILVSSKQELHSEDEAVVLRALHKVHKNLGHPSSQDLVRVLKHGGASDKALELARALKCDFCLNQARPKVPLPAKSSRHTQFNQCLGIDVKFLPGWKPGQKIKALNLVDQASCFQIMVPFHERETSVLLRTLVEDHWFRWAGAPAEVIMDPAQTMLGEHLQSLFEAHGTNVKFIAAEAHWQLGRTENHGGWFARVLEKMLQERSPMDRISWEHCVKYAHVKNQMIQNYGFTPHQFVFGKNPNLPSDLLNEPLHVVPATAGLMDQEIEKAQSLRTSARKAVVELQDDKALRQALMSRPRVSQEFQAGELVAYWREQKYSHAQRTVVQGGCWHGTAMIIGRVGRNYIIAHRKQIFRCAPEQLRPATTEEKVLVQTPEAELLGIKDLIEGGTFKGKQYVDLVPGQYPPTMPGSANPHGPPVQLEPVESPEAVPISPRVPETASSLPQASEPMVVPDENMSPEPTDPSQNPLEPNPDTEMPGDAEASSSSYGPIRRRVRGKSDERAMFRPPAMREDDFIEIMREVVPRLVDQAVEHVRSPSDERTPAAKRELETAETPAPHRPRNLGEEALTVMHEPHCEEVLSVQEWQACENDIAVLIAAHIQKKATKELPPTGNSSQLQQLVNESKTAEWSTIVGKGAVKLHFGKKAQHIRDHFQDRFIGSRFVITRKATEKGLNVDVSDPSTYKIKSRWCLQGHLDPDLEQKAQDGALQSRTLSQPSRVLLMQILASYGWELQLGDIKGAFMEAGPLNPKYRPLYAKIPVGGIPNVPNDAVIEVTGNVYGQNDAPCAWFKTFDMEAKVAGWVPSRFDPCLYTLRSTHDSSLIGILGVHVDDSAVGGMGPEFEASIKHLKQRFPYRKWRRGSGEFCGAFYQQDPHTMTISMCQESFAETLKPAYIPKGVSAEKLLDAAQIRTLRGINGSLNWLANQSRPDLADRPALVSNVSQTQPSII